MVSRSPIFNVAIFSAKITPYLAFSTIMGRDLVNFNKNNWFCCYLAWKLAILKWWHTFRVPFIFVYGLWEKRLRCVEQIDKNWILLKQIGFRYSFFCHSSKSILYLEFGRDKSIFFHIFGSVSRKLCIFASQKTGSLYLWMYESKRQFGE